MSKQYIAIYDESKLFSDLFHNSLERIHQYDVLFSTESEEQLLRFLTNKVNLLLYHATERVSHVNSLVTTILGNYIDLKILLYSKHAEELNFNFEPFASRIKIVSAKKSSIYFFETLNELLPGHKNHIEEIAIPGEIHDYYPEGFEKIKNNRKKQVILKCISKGLKPKQVVGIEGLKLNSINTYIERMMEDTGCKNQTELVLQARIRGII